MSNCVATYISLDELVDREVKQTENKQQYERR